MFNVLEIDAELQPRVEAMSYGSWYYAADLTRLWQVDTGEMRSLVRSLVRLGALRVDKRAPNYGRQGAPRNVYCRADSFVDGYENQRSGRDVRTAEDEDEEATE